MVVKWFGILQSSWCSCLGLEVLGEILVYSNKASSALALHQDRLAVLHFGSCGALISSFTKMWYSSSHGELEGGVKQSCNGHAQGIYRIFTGDLKDFNKTEQLT